MSSFCNILLIFIYKRSEIFFKNACKSGKSNLNLYKMA